MLAAGPAPDHYNPDLTPVLRLLGELGERRSVHDLAVAKPNLRLFVHRHSNRSTEGAVRA
jgi:oxaloacetate decarboxylase (Na+ extruding) subunit alpha